MAEFVAAIFEGFCALLEVFLRVLHFLIAGSVTIAAFAVSPKYRDKKRKEWVEKPRRKFIELGVSGASLVGLVALLIWVSRPVEHNEESLAKSIDFVPAANTNEDFRVKLKGAEQSKGSNDITLSVKKHGAKKILGTETMDELRSAIKENVSVAKADEKRETLQGEEMATPKLTDSQTK